MMTTVLTLTQSPEADSQLAAFTSSPPAGCSALRPALMRVQLALEVGGASGQQKALELLSNLPMGQGEPDVSHSGAVLASRLALHQQVAQGKT